MAANVEERFPLGTLVRQHEYGDSVFEVVGFWRGQPRLRSDLDTTHVASPSSLVPLDLAVELHGSVALLSAKSEAGRRWLDENVDYDLTLGGKVAGEPRYVEAILDGAASDGLEVLR